MAFRLFVVAFALALLARQSFAGSFLASSPIKAEDLEADLLAEFAKSGNGSIAAGQRLLSLEAALRPMFSAVPLEQDGTISHNVARYVLQRFFAHQHGWFIRGLDVVNSTSTGATNPDLAMQMQQEWAPAYLQRFLENMVSGRGCSLKELALLTATLEDLIHMEEKRYLAQAYAAQGQDTSNKLDPQAAFEVLETYMMIYEQGGNWTATMAQRVDKLREIFLRKVAHWDETLEFVSRLIRKSVAAAEKRGEPGLDHEGAMLPLTREIGDRFADFNTVECGRLKTDLLTKESAKAGRIRLVDFYKLGLQGAWDFKEKIEFLRDIGSLDESDPSTPLVILPNYMQARTNCLSVSSFYAVCCPNECEHLLQHLEANIVSSTARVSHIANIVSSLSTPTISAPRTLPVPLMRRLQDIASHHGGEVPLHGRLFAQWMHHAFPRECSYPHVGGTVSSQTADEWMEKTGQADASLTREEILTEVASDTCRLLPKGVECDHKGEAPEDELNEEDDGELPWDPSEELLVVHEQSTRPMIGKITPFSAMCDIMFWCALSSFFFGLCWALKWTKAGQLLSIWAGVPLPSMTKKADKCCI